jgi:hypothetical protein
MAEIKVNEAFDFFREFLNVSWNTIEIFSKDKSFEWSHNWLQANYEMIVEYYCNQISSEPVCLDYYGNGAEDFDISLPAEMRVSPQRVSYTDVEVSHTIICKPKYGKRIKEVIHDKEVGFPFKGLIFGNLIRFDTVKHELGSGPFNVVEIDDPQLPSPLFFNVLDLDFYVVPLENGFKK